MKMIEVELVKINFPQAAKEAPEPYQGKWFYFLDVNFNLIAESSSGLRFVWNDCIGWEQSA